MLGRYRWSKEMSRTVWLALALTVLCTILMAWSDKK